MLFKYSHEIDKLLSIQHIYISLILDIHHLVNWHLLRQCICWPASQDYIRGSGLELIKVTCCYFFDCNTDSRHVNLLLSGAWLLYVDKSNIITLPLYFNKLFNLILLFLHWQDNNKPMYIIWGNIKCVILYFVKENSLKPDGILFLFSSWTWWIWSSRTYYGLYIGV